MNFTNWVAKRATDYRDTQSVGSRFRANRIRPLYALIDECFQKEGCVHIVDVGGTLNYWNIIPRQYLKSRNVRITLVNLPGTEKQQDTDLFLFREGDGCSLKEFQDQSFHIAHSNSVLEHVGGWSEKVRFANEIARVGKHFFVQTPNYWFPVEPHCLTPLFHWLPEPIRLSLVLHCQLGHWRKAESVDQAVRIVESARLVDKRMLQSLFLGAQILTERFLGLSKSFVAIR